MNEEKSRSILVIDDDPVLTKLADSRLKANGYNVTVCNEAPEGLERAINDKPDLIVLDVMMPIVNGYNFCRLLKSQQGHMDIPIIFLTSRDGEDDKKIGAEVGANAYITKPFNIEDLLNKINELLSG